MISRLSFFKKGNWEGSPLRPPLYPACRKLPSLSIMISRLSFFEKGNWEGSHLMPHLYPAFRKSPPYRSWSPVYESVKKEVEREALSCHPFTRLAGNHLLIDHDFPFIVLWKRKLRGKPSHATPLPGLPEITILSILISLIQIKTKLSVYNSLQLIW